jgi:probable rRNA maturation factor
MSRSRTSSSADPSICRTGRAPSGLLRLDIVEEGGDWRGLGAPAEAVRAAGRALVALVEIGAEPLAAAVALSTDERVRALNRAYRGIDKPTNVLSFPAPAPPDAASAPGPQSLGDIVLAFETLCAEAAEQGVSPRHHLQHLVVHGLLHLLGYDHETDADADEMEALEVEILARLGVADPYAAAGAQV